MTATVSPFRPHRGKRRVRDYIYERDMELRRRFRETAMADSTTTFSSIEIWRRIVAQPAPRFYMSEQRARRCVYDLRHGKFRPLTQGRRRLVAELSTRYDLALEDDPSLTLTEFIIREIDSGAPEFYMTAESAMRSVERTCRRYNLPL